MKKNILFIGIALYILAAAASTTFAYEYDTAFTKLGRGFANILTAPGELYTQPIMMSNDYDAVTSLIGGFFKGMAMFGLRECVGIYDVLTFPLPFPRDYRPVMEPATTFANWEERRP